MEELNFDIQIPTAEQAETLVNRMPFPEAVTGDKVCQYNYWFELTESGWVPIPSPV